MATSDPLFNCLVNRGSEALCRVVCFPWSGGGSAVYSRWGRCVPDHIEIYGVRLPGRENRYKDAVHETREALVKEVAEGIIRRRFFSSTEVAFFGHSLGAIMAVETALYLKKHHHLEPSHLFVSGASAPNSPAFKEYLKTRKYSQMSDDEIKAWLIKQGGTPKQVLDDKEFFKIHLRALKADLNIVENYKFEHDLSEMKLSCPISCFDGDNDSPHDMDSFCLLTSSSDFSKTVLPGGHFYLLQEDNQRTILEAIAANFDGQNDIV